MEKLADHLGYLIINEDGAITSSSGDLENDERVAEVLYGMLNVICKKNLLPTGTSGNFHRMLVHYGTYLYSITLSNRKFHIVKRKYQPAEPVVV